MIKKKKSLVANEKLGRIGRAGKFRECSENVPAYFKVNDKYIINTNESKISNKIKYK